MSYLPMFQPQNPAFSHYALGWSSCTAFSAAMAGDFHTLGQKRPTGGQVRTRTGDTVGGLNLSQVDEALYEGWNINLDTVYRLSWDAFAKKINEGRGAVLQGYYTPIADSRFDAGRGFRGNHAMFVAPAWVGMDPLADGRASGVYKYHGEAYPQALLRSFAGKLVLGPKTALGDGLVYASFTRDNVTPSDWRVSVSAGKIGLYTVSGTKILTARAGRTGGFSATCTPPRLYSWAGHTSQRLVVLTSGSRAGLAIRATHASENP